MSHNSNLSNYIWLDLVTEPELRVELLFIFCMSMSRVIIHNNQNIFFIIICFTYDLLFIFIMGFLSYLDFNVIFTVSLI
jgi:hypothetical protein